MQTARSIVRIWLVATVTACAVAVPTIVHAEKLAASVASARLGNERPCIRFDFGRAITGSRNTFAAGDGGTR